MQIMTSKERMLAAIECRAVDHIPCSFMLFTHLYEKCRDDSDFVEKTVQLGLDAVAHVGHLNHTLHEYGGLHPDVTVKEWTENTGGMKYFCRRIDTPAGALTGRVRQQENWPVEGNFPLMKDWIVPRADEILVKPERDLEKLKYLLGPIKDRDIAVLKRDAAEAARIARKYDLLQVGGWKGFIHPGLQVDPGVMGCDAMAWLSGYETVMMLSLADPAIIREYARIIHEWNLKQIEVYLDVTGADLIIRRAWYETTDFWTPAAYRDIVVPTIRREAEVVHQAGRKYGYIITSAFMPLLDDILDAGVDVLIGFDPEEGKQPDPAAVKSKFAAKRKALWGGVSGALTVELGTQEQTETAVIRAIETFGPGSGFILSPVDNVCGDTENTRRNTRVFIDTWKKYCLPATGQVK